MLKTKLNKKLYHMPETLAEVGSQKLAMQYCTVFGFNPEKLEKLQTKAKSIARIKSEYIITQPNIES